LRNELAKFIIHNLYFWCLNIKTLNWIGLAQPGGPTHINGQEKVGPLDSWAIKIEPNTISSGLHGLIGQLASYFKMYYFIYYI